MRTVLTFMLPEDIDYHTDTDENILVFDSLDEIAAYCNENNISLDNVKVFDVEVIDD